MEEGKDYLFRSPPGSQSSAEDCEVAEVVVVVLLLVVVEVARIVEAPTLKVVALLDVDSSCAGL